MGSEDLWAYPGDGEGPVRRVTLDAFWIDACAVTNAAFARFVSDTGYETEAERFGWSFVFAGLLPDDFPPTRAVAQAPWWRQVDGATGATRRGRTRSRRPAGPPGRARDAGTTRRRTAPGRATAAHRGRVGVRRARRAGGAAVPVGRRARAGWRAPHERLAGHVPGGEYARRRLLRHLPGRRLPAERLGLHNTTGNVWEWCADWFSRLPHARPAHEPARPGAARTGPRGWLVPLPRVVLPPLPRLGAQRPDPGLDGRERRLPLCTVESGVRDDHCPGPECEAHRRDRENRPHTRPALTPA